MHSTTFGSVCSGIEAASVAFHPLGWRAAWLAEIEAFPSAVLAHHYPDVPNLGDMTLLPDAVRAGSAAAPDVLCGGTPCQAFSVAGNRESLADARGNLTLTFCEIADAIDAVRHERDDEPCVVLWENVPGVLSTKDNAFGCFLGALAGSGTALVPGRKQRWTNAGVVAGPRRVVAWRTLDAQFFGLAQRRRRVFVVASAREGFDPAAVLLEPEGLRRHPAPRAGARQDVAPTVAGGARKRGGYSTDDIGLTAHTLRAEGFDAREDGTGRGTLLVAVAVALRGREGGGSIEVGDEKAFALRASSGGGDKPHVLAYGGNNTAGPINVATARNACASGSGRMDFESETFIVQPPVFLHCNKGRPAGRQSAHTEMVTVETDTIPTVTTDGHAQSAICFDPTQITSAANRSNPQPGDPCHTLAKGQHAPAIAFNSKQSSTSQGPSFDEVAPTLDVAKAGGMAMQQSMQVRRLMPVECERLQGFPDGYTAIAYRGKPAADGPRYKALGNSWAVPCAAWIGRRIAQEMER